MNVREAINQRRAYRSLEPVKITKEMIEDLARSASLFCSCFNNQPWRYVFVYDAQMLKKIHTALSTGNEWAQAASMIVAVFSKPEFDCVIKSRNYYLFDTGMATAALILRATEMGLVAHPIAGYRPKRIQEILDIPSEMEVITLVIIGKHATAMNPILSEKQVEAEKKRPERLIFEKFAYFNSYKGNEA